MQIHLQTKTEDSMTKTEAQQQVDNWFTEEQSKGLLLFGPNGTGKTTALRPYSKTMWAIGSIPLANEVQNHGRQYLDKFSMHNMIIDDLGREPLTVKSYGDEVSVIHDLIFIRYQAFQRGYMTHITTNLSFTEIEERYGVPIADRIKEMCSVIEFKGESLRA